MHTDRNEVKWDEQIVPLTAVNVPHTQQQQQRFISSDDDC